MASANPDRTHEVMLLVRTVSAATVKRKPRPSWSDEEGDRTVPAEGERRLIERQLWRRGRSH